MALVSLMRLRLLAGEHETILRAKPEDAPELDLAWIEDRAGLAAVAGAVVADGEGPPEGLEQHLADGGRMLAAWHEGRPVAWTQFMRGRQLNIPWLCAEADAASVFAFGGYTVKPWRGKRLFDRLARYSSAWYLNDGCWRRLSIVNFNNTASLRANGRRNPTSIGWIARARLPRRLSVVVTDRGSSAGFYSAANRYVYRVAGPDQRDG